ncbi:MAG: DUF1850 domain-containing protein [Thermoclostridium sp.]|nr:DUF1850 domain-containing protein [Thermoclostridium sp.]
MPRKWAITEAAVVVTILASVFILYVLSSPALILKNADTGEIISVYPIEDGDEFSITFIHSVNNSPVTDYYEIRNKGIYVVRTKYYSFGAGVQTEVEQGQTLEYGSDGSMTVSGFELRLDKLSYIVGTVSDHMLEIGGETISLRELCGRNTTVVFLVKRRLLFNTNTGSK